MTSATQGTESDRDASPAQVTIRALRAADLPDLHDLMNGPNAVSGTMQQPFRTLEWRVSKFEKHLTDPDTLNLVAANGAGKVVGNLGLYTNSRNPRRKHTADLGMSVHDDWQGRGIGSKLMAAAVDAADNWLNVHRIQLEVYAENEAAVGLYRKFGFQEEGTLRDFAFRNGRYVDALVMGRLRPAG